MTVAVGGRVWVVGALDYQAVAAGWTSIALSYLRTFESVQPASTWSVGVTVR